MTAHARGDAPEQSSRLEVTTNLKPEFVEEKLARPETIPFFDLPAQDRAARSFGLKANGFAMQFHSLIALPLLLVAMTLIAATVSMRFARMGQSATMILGGVLAGLSALCRIGFGEGIRDRRNRAAFRCGMDSGCGCDVFWGDVLLYKEDG